MDETTITIKTRTLKHIGIVGCIIGLVLITLALIYIPLTDQLFDAGQTEQELQFLKAITALLPIGLTIFMFSLLLLGEVYARNHKIPDTSKNEITE